MLARIRVRRRPSHAALVASIALVALSVPVVPVAAQEAVAWSDEIPAHVAVLDGTASLERDSIVEPLELNTVLVAGDRLRTDNGRVEILFGDGSVLDVDRYSSIDMLADTLVRLVDGRVRMTVARSTDAEYRIDAAGGSAIFRSAGEYRVSSGDPRRGSAQVELAVYRGAAELRNASGATLVRAGTYAVASAGAAPSLPYAVNSAAWDEFDAWAYDLRDGRVGSPAAGYLPANLSYYGGALESAGSWSYEDSHGPVWYPQVAADWYPYSHGSWSVVGRFGWVWVGAERWSWPTHHYGRWGHRSGRWFWIPDRVWAPAWVTWASAPGYIGWSPLGFDNRPFVSITTVIHTGPRYGWSVLPAHQWKRRVHVTNSVIPHHRLRGTDWERFREDRRGPAYVNVRGERVDPPAGPVITGRAVPRRGIASTDPAPRLSTPDGPARRLGTSPVSPASRRVVTRPPASTVSPAARAPRDSRSQPVRAPARPRVIDTSRPHQPEAARTRPAVRSAPPSASGRAPSQIERSNADPPSRRAVSRRQPEAAAPPPNRVIRSAPASGAPDRRSAGAARPRSSQPAASAPSSRPAAASRRGGGQSPPPAASAPASRGGARPNPNSGSGGRGSARPRGGGGGR